MSFKQEKNDTRWKYGFIKKLKSNGKGNYMSKYVYTLIVTIFLYL